MHAIRQLPGNPMPVSVQVAVLYAGTNKWLVRIPVGRLPEALKALRAAIADSQTGQTYDARFRKSPVLDDELRGLLDSLMREVLTPFQQNAKK